MTTSSLLRHRFQLKAERQPVAAEGAAARNHVAEARHAAEVAAEGVVARQLRRRLPPSPHAVARLPQRLCHLLPRRASARQTLSTA